mgnify:CR=1 FL=1
MSRFFITDSPLIGLKSLKRKRLGDHRGFLERLFCAEELIALGWHDPISQINLTRTLEKGTVRGLHFQYPPYTEMKLVTCIRGEAWDVAVDLRQGSPTFLKWHAEILSEENGKALLIPEGFAHGFQTLTDNVELIYCHSRAYTPNAEAGINPCDSKLSIKWPHSIQSISERDNAHTEIDEKFKGIRI